MKQRVLSGSVLGSERNILVKTLDLQVMIDPAELTVDQRLGDGSRHDSVINQADFGKFLTVKEVDSPYKQVVTLFSSDTIKSVDHALLVRSGLALNPIGFEHFCALHAQRSQDLDCFGWVVDLDHTTPVRGIMSTPCIWGMQNSLYLKWVVPTGVGTMFIGVNK